MLYRFLIMTLVVMIHLTTLGCKAKDTHAEGADQGNSQSAIMEESATGLKKAPDFALKSTDGKIVRLSDYKNKIVIVDFWATWCPPCRKGIPDLIELQNEFKKDVVIIGISVDRESIGDVAPFIKKQGVNYPVVYFDNKVVDDFGGIEAIPSSFVIDKNRNIVDSHVGLVDKSAYVEVIKKLLAK